MESLPCLGSIDGWKMLNEPKSVPQLYGMTIHHRLGGFDGAVIVFDADTGGADDSIVLCPEGSLGMRERGLH